LIRWGYYFRQTLPLTGMIRIQRVRCKLCGRTTHVLPSFLLARRRHGVKVLENFIRTFVDNHCNWKQLLDISLDLSTAYRWLRIISQQALEVLPDIRKELLTLIPDHPLKQCQPEPVPSTQILLKRFLLLSRQLFKAAVRLAEPKDPLKEDLFCFLNLFLTQKTGKPLLTL
jgi:hypothetical protein